jgi:chromosome partitioning protein
MSSPWRTQGGVGKSTIAGNLAAGSPPGHGVVVDADPQHSLVAWANRARNAGRLRREFEGSAATRGQGLARLKDADIVLIDTPPGMPEMAYQAALAADLMLLPCGPSPLDLFALKEALSLALKARAERRSKKPRIRLVPSKVLMTTNLGRSLTSTLKGMGRKVLPAIGQRVVVAEAVASGLTVAEYAPDSPAHEEFRELAKAVDKILRR